MSSNEISYIFPEKFETKGYILPETAIESNITFADRNDIIDNIIPDENIILKKLLKSNSDTSFGYLHKGDKTTKTIKEASDHLGLRARYILKTIITKDTNNNIYKIITLGDFGNINKIKPSQGFIDNHNIDLPLKLKLTDKDQVKTYTGIEGGFCRPVPLDKEYMDCLEGILIQNTIRNIEKLDKKKILLTFPVGHHESLLIPPKELYKILNNEYKDKVTSFKSNN